MWKLPSLPRTDAWTFNVTVPGGAWNVKMSALEVTEKSRHASAT